MTVPDPSTPPPPRLPTARLEALRAAASVFRGKGGRDAGSTRVGAHDVLAAADEFAEWLEGGS